MQQEERPTAYARARRLDDRQSRRHRYGGIERIATVIEYRATGSRCRRMSRGDRILPGAGGGRG